MCDDTFSKYQGSNCSFCKQILHKKFNFLHYKLINIFHDKFTYCASCTHIVIWSVLHNSFCDKLRFHLRVRQRNLHLEIYSTQLQSVNSQYVLIIGTLFLKKKKQLKGLEQYAIIWTNYINAHEIDKLMSSWLTANVVLSAWRQLGHMWFDSFVKYMGDSQHGLAWTKTNRTRDCRKKLIWASPTSRLQFHCSV